MFIARDISTGKEVSSVFSSSYSEHQPSIESALEAGGKKLN